MWLERSVMFPTLHSTISNVLTSNEATKVQFILEPLAFPQLANCFQIHGQRFIEQLSYLTRTFAFYIHREYQKILKVEKTKSHQTESLPDLTNPISVTAHPDSLPSPPLTTHDVTQQLPSPGHVQYQPRHCHGGAPPSTDNTCNLKCSAQLSTSGSTVQNTRVTTIVSPSPTTPGLVTCAGYQQHTAGHCHVPHTTGHTAHHGAGRGDVSMGSEGLGVTTQARLSFNMSNLLSSGALSVSSTSEEGGMILV